MMAPSLHAIRRSCYFAFFFLERDGASSEPVQRAAISLLLFLIMDLTWRFACALACPRIDPAIEFAPLSQILNNGFFLIQGFFMLSIAFAKNKSVSHAAAQRGKTSTLPKPSVRDYWMDNVPIVPIVPMLRGLLAWMVLDDISCQANLYQ